MHLPVPLHHGIRGLLVVCLPCYFGCFGPKSKFCFQQPPAGFDAADFYSNLLLSENMEILCETEKRLKEAGVNLEDLHVEPAPGQFEFNYQPAWGILGALK